MTSSASPAINFERFAVSVRTTNPFVKNRVSEVQEATDDVTAIHEQKFSELKRRVEGVREQSSAAGVLLLGGAGLGKSHLLGRLARWSRQENKATLVFLHNVLSSPERIPFYLLKATVSALAGQRLGCDYAESELYALLNRAVFAENHSAEHRGAPPLARRVQALETLGTRIDPGGTVMPVLIHFLEGTVRAAQGSKEMEKRARAAVRWLSGEDLEAEDAEQLGIKVANANEPLDADEDRVESIYRVLASVSAASGRPFVLCIDQVDNLQERQVSALTAFLHVLIDHTPNLVVVVSGIKETMFQLRDSGTIPEAAWDRIAQYSITLSRIQVAEARQILEHRLEAFLNPFRAEKAVQRLRQTDSLFPLGSSWFEERVADMIELRARDIITWARERWEEQQFELERLGAEAWQSQWGGAPRTTRPNGCSLEERVDEEVRKKFMEAVAQRTLNPDSLPPDADNLATLVKTLLAYCTGNRRYTLTSVESIPENRKRRPVYDLSARERRTDGVEVRNGLCFLTGETKTANTAALRRMLEDSDAPDHRMLVTDEDRCPLSIGDRGRDYYRQLCGLGHSAFWHAKLKFSDYAELDALATVLGAARVGDLEVEDGSGCPRPVDEAAVAEALHRQNYFVSHKLLRELLTESTSPQPRPRSVLVLNVERARQTIRAELAWRLGMTTREATEVFLKHESIDTKHFDEAHAELKGVAQDMHQNGLIFAAAQNDELFLQLRIRA